MDTIWLELILIMVAILANGLFAGSEIALVSARPARLMQLREQGMRGAGAAVALKREPETFLATVQIAITRESTLSSAVGGAAAVKALTPRLQSLPVPGAWTVGRAGGVGSPILAITYVSLVLGELVPKALALRKREAACLVAPAPPLLHGRPPAPGLLTRSTRAVLAMLGQRDAPTAPLVSEEEIRYLVREGATHGVLECDESEILLERVFRFTDTPVRAIMVPRLRIQALSCHTPPREVLRRVVASGRTRLPAYRSSLEEIVGVVVIKDLLREAAERKGTVPENLLPPSPVRAGNPRARATCFASSSGATRTWRWSSTISDGPRAS